MTRRVTGYWCARKTTGWSVTCSEPARFLVGLPGETGDPVCAQHLAKAITGCYAAHDTTQAVVQHLPYLPDRQPA